MTTNGDNLESDTFAPKSYGKEESKHLGRERSISNELDVKPMKHLSQASVSLGPIQSQNPRKLITFETLAVGGRYDNLIANFNPVGIPVAVGVRFFCQKLIQRVVFHEQRRGTPLHSVDVVVVSLGDMT